MISVSEWIELMKMLSDPSCVINSKAFETVRNDVERCVIESHPCVGSFAQQSQGGASD